MFHRMLGAHLQKSSAFDQQSSSSFSTALTSPPPSSSTQQQQQHITPHHTNSIGNTAAHAPSQYYHQKNNNANITLLAHQTDEPSSDSLIPSISGGFSCDNTPINPIVNMMLSTTASTITTAGPQCIHCGKVYSNASNLRQHVRNVHALVDKSMWHKCNACGKRLKTKHYLINHQLQAHGIHQRG